MESNCDHQHNQARLLIQRLARLSADSIWARRASGVRAALDKALTRRDAEAVERLVEQGYAMLEKAAAEIPVPEDILRGRERKP